MKVEQEVVDKFIKKVVKKYPFQFIKNDKEAIKELVTKFKKVVEKFIEEEEKRYKESHNHINRKVDALRKTNSPEDSLQTDSHLTQPFVESKNDINKVKIFK
ncbi:hypothetical protein [Halalkalibacter hemicellulosilyticus]|uniref:Uncharacterized protein n=1 Tax=Halalkalibacter hemicellulosilyticusJCM 9152 TaxID=1236971 RepID=W4QFA7_9BACI|nr:hypothetical protein [Halalkalibacter hemicellulosilyticus]GAE30766.1 hypothetical protein JCM9152_2182 [Halalkalibacter hemicellulosilyticusJCM 9152]